MPDPSETFLRRLEPLNISACKHMVLLLGQTLHRLPWESMPVLSEVCLTRAPSACWLARQIELLCGSAPANVCRDGVQLSSVAALVDPKGDLIKSAGRLLPLLHDKWASSVSGNHLPSAEQIRHWLTCKDVFLYSGHGSGREHVPASALMGPFNDCSKQAAGACLFGCSSGRLSSSHLVEDAMGPPYHWLIGGAPFVACVLWDVTDGDLTRITAGVLTHWFHQSPSELLPGKHPAQKLAQGSNPLLPLSLSEALLRSRRACLLPHLVGASVVVYGTPVYLQSSADPSQR